MPTVFIYSLRFVFYSSLGRKLSHLCSLSNCGDLFQLESHGQEILDELYVVYCCLQSGPNTASDTHYRHFVIDHRSTITIKESSSLISQGTTGLCSWQVLRNILKQYIFVSFLFLLLLVVLRSAGSEVRSITHLRWW
jgi:hypothetical protein